jgi:hypothetical protein
VTNHNWTPRRVIHAMICWYLRRCWGAFHHGPYGAAGGRYVVLMNERQYHEYTLLAHATMAREQKCCPYHRNGGLTAECGGGLA